MGLIFLHMLEHMGNLAKTGERHFEDGIVQATLDYIDVCYQSASLTEMARRFHQPLSGLSRLIRQTTGVTFRELLMNKRFQKALVMLVETDLPVEEIAVNVGYENQSYFYRQFKKRYGVTPRSYRLLHGKPPERRKTGKPEHIAGGGFLLE